MWIGLVVPQERRGRVVIKNPASLIHMKSVQDPLKLFPAMIGRGILRRYAVWGRWFDHLHELGGGHGYDLHLRLGLHRRRLLPPNVPQGRRSCHDTATKPKSGNGVDGIDVNGGHVCALFPGKCNVPEVHGYVTQFEHVVSSSMTTGTCQ